MNYEELLVAKSGGKLNQTQMPIGEFYRAKQDDGKYKSVVDIRRPLVDNITFSGAIKRECEDNTTIADNHQLHFTPTVEHDDVVRLNIVETGQYMSFAEILRDTPAVVARQDFLESVLEGLVSVTRLLHTKGIRHICYSPNTVFARKGDLVPLLISHGSYYLVMSDLQAFYGDDAQYVAPEVLQHGSIDDRCDVYSIGKFLDSLVSWSICPWSIGRPSRRPPAMPPKTAITRRTRCSVPCAGSTILSGRPLPPALL
jgi:hypothetical protein